MSLLINVYTSSPKDGLLGLGLCVHVRARPRVCFFKCYATVCVSSTVGAFVPQGK